MRQYCINDFLDSSFGMLTFLRQKKMSQLYIQLQDCGCTDGIVDFVMKQRGEEIGKILIYKEIDDKDSIKEISIVAPLDGYYFIEPVYVLNRIKNIDISHSLIKCYEDLGEDINDGEEHFVNSYNELMTALVHYYDGYIDSTEIRRKFSYFGKCDFSVGLSKTDEPLDFLSLIDKLLRERQYLSTKDTIRRCQTITHFVEKASPRPYSSSIMVFIASKSLVVNGKLIPFKEISKLCKNEKVKNRANECLFYALSSLQKSIVQNIIEANRNGADYSNICDEKSLKGIEKSFSIYDLIQIEDRKSIPLGEWEFKLVNEFDIAFPDACINPGNIKRHYYLTDDKIFELTNADGEKILAASKDKGYYSFYVPAFIDSIFFDIPFVDYFNNEELYDALKGVYDALCPKDFKIEQDRFSKAKTLIWSSADNIQILPDEWYEFRVGFNYIKNETTIMFGFKNVYSKQTLNNKYKTIDGKYYYFYLLLEDGESYEYNKRNYRETYIGENDYHIWVEYTLGMQEINSFLHNAIEAVRICTPEGEIFEYEAEPSLYDNFKKYVKVYYDAIVKCDGSLKCDIGESSRIAESCFVYLMHDLANNYYKIGISNNPAYREHTLQSEKPTIELIIAKEFPVRRIAEAFEAALHKTYEAKRLRGEWFRLDSNDVIDLIKALS